MVEPIFYLISKLILSENTAQRLNYSTINLRCDLLDIYFAPDYSPHSTQCLQMKSTHYDRVFCFRTIKYAPEFRSIVIVNLYEIISNKQNQFWLASFLI